MFLLITTLFNTCYLFVVSLPKISSMEFDPFGLSVKDLATRCVLRRNSSGPCTLCGFLLLLLCNLHCLHMHDPQEPYPTVVKCIIRYFHGTLDYNFLLRRSSMAEFVVYTDADWMECLVTRRSTSGYTMFFGDNLVSCLSKRQHIVSCLSAEAQYRCVDNGVAEAY